MTGREALVFNMKKVSHHYVPRFYLKNFSNDKKSIGLYLVNHKKYVETASIKNQACKDNLYGEDGRLETALSQMERMSCATIKKIIGSCTLPPKNTPEYDLILIFMLVSETRTLKTAESMTHLFNHQLKSIAQVDKRVNFTEDQIRNLEFSLDIPNLPSMQVALEIYPVLKDLKPLLLISKNDRQFITSDNPLVKYNQLYVERDYTLRGYGLINMGLQLFLPISPKLCICILDDKVYDYGSTDDRGNIVITKGKQVDELNELFYLNSFNALYFNDTVNEKYIKRIESKTQHTGAEIEKEVNTFYNTNGQLIAYSPRKVTEKIKLPFNVYREYYKYPLPSHMGGPIRPHAAKFVPNDPKPSGKIDEIFYKR